MGDGVKFGMAQASLPWLSTVSLTRVALWSTTFTLALILDSDGKAVGTRASFPCKQCVAYEFQLVFLRCTGQEESFTALHRPPLPGGEASLHTDEDFGREQLEQLDAVMDASANKPNDATLESEMAALGCGRASF